MRVLSRTPCIKQLFRGSKISTKRRVSHTPLNNITFKITFTHQYRNVLFSHCQRIYICANPPNRHSFCVMKLAKIFFWSTPLYTLYYTRKQLNKRKRVCDTVLAKNPFFLWEFNMGKMDEKQSLMINQQKALIVYNQYSTKKRLKQKKRALI